MKRLIYHFKIWLRMSKNAFLIMLSQKVVFVIFLTGKLLRFGFFITFLYFLIHGASNLAGYNINQGLFFFLTFTLIDTVSQFLFREVYRFRSQVISGDFDLTLVKPINPLFRALLSGADIIDLTILPLIIFFVFRIGVTFLPSSLDVLYYVLLILNSLVIAAAFHITVLAIGIITLEVDHTIMIFRDLTSLGRFPIEIYKQPLQSILTYAIPVGIMMSFPAKALMGLVSINGIVFACLLSGSALFLALRFWHFALKKYTSASS